MADLIISQIPVISSAAEKSAHIESLIKQVGYVLAAASYEEKDSILVRIFVEMEEVVYAAQVRKDAAEHIKNIAAWRKSPTLVHAQSATR